MNRTRANLIGLAGVAVIAVLWIVGSGSSDQPEDRSWSWTSRDGQSFVVACDGDTSCTNGVPDPIVHMNRVYREDGCRALEREVARWDGMSSNERAYRAYGEQALTSRTCGVP